MEKTKKKSIFDTPLLSTKIKSANAKLFPEGVLGYFIGPTLALLANSILSGYFNRYMSDVLGMTSWAKDFFNWLPLISVIFVVLGNILVGRLMDHSKTRAGKARPLLLLAVPICILALLFLFIFTPFPTDIAKGSSHIALLVLIAIGYNLWFAVGYPLYFTPHSALVNLSTRNSKSRSLLATISNATALAAMGLSTMFLPLVLNKLFVPQTVIENIPELVGAIVGTPIWNEVDKVWTAAITIGGVGVATAFYGNNASAFGELERIVNNNTNSEYLNRQASFNNWKIFVIALIVITVIGAIIEYYFTRERVTEEALNSGATETKKATPIGKQAKACFKDKFWWLIIAFFFLYQLGGMVKNVSQMYYCYTMFPENGAYTVKHGGDLQAILSIIGAVPTALGMVIAWPLSNKIGKGKSIMFGAILSAIGGAIGFIDPTNFILVTVSFVVKALGSTPAMYLSLALLADILDHQEAKNKFRTDGFTMTIYGAIMAGMTGIATTILNVVLSNTGYDAANGIISNEAIRTAMPWVFIGVETICYAIIAVMFIFMSVEKFSKQDHETILENQKAEAEARGEEWIPPEERMRLEEEEADRQAEEARKAELKARCEKKGLDYEAEEAKYQAAQEQKRQAAEAKKAAKEAKKAAKTGAQPSESPVEPNAAEPEEKPTGSEETPVEPEATDAADESGEKPEADGEE